MAQHELNRLADIDFEESPARRLCDVHGVFAVDADDAHASFESAGIGCGRALGHTLDKVADSCVFVPPRPDKGEPERSVTLDDAHGHSPRLQRPCPRPCGGVQ